MVKKAKKAKAKKAGGAKKKKRSKVKVAAMLGNLEAACPGMQPVLWQKQGDGSWLICFLQADCTYGNCRPATAADLQGM